LDYYYYFGIIIIIGKYISGIREKVFILEKVLREKLRSGRKEEKGKEL
jgi:hypothetical protein